jgi:ribosomal protein S18 acetylase RimI-like enzyme
MSNKPKLHCKTDYITYMKSIIFRKAIPTDFISISDLDRRAWLENYGGDRIPDGEHTWRIWCEYAVVFLAEHENLMVGAILAFPSHEDLYCLHKIMVDKAHRSNGIASELFKLALAELDRLGVMSFLTVDPNNHHAIKLYEKMGYNEKIFHKGYYQADEDRFVMRRSAR